MPTRAGMDDGVFVSEVYRRSASSGRGSSEDSSATGGSSFGGAGVGGGSTEECLFKQPLCQPLANGCALDRSVCSILYPFSSRFESIMRFHFIHLLISRSEVG